MVFFNCNACGEALKKNQVEKHTYRCRQCQVVSCVDCSKDFWGNDYQTHTKCMTENEKYCGKGYVAKVNKGEVKQEKWIEKVQNAIEQSSSDPKLKGLLQRLQDYPNIPRKKAKFENFLKNSMRVLNPYLITQVWNLLMEQTSAETADTKPIESSPATTNTVKTEISEKINGVHDTDENEQTRNLSKREKKEQRQKKNKKEKKDKPILENNDENVIKTKKRKRADSEDNNVEENETLKKIKKKKKKTEDQEQSVQDSIEISKEDGRLNDTLVSDSSNKNEKFKWGATIIALLEKKGEISYKKLRRKIMQEFASQDGVNFKEESIQIKFDKKLRKLSQSQIVVTDGRISMR